MLSTFKENGRVLKSTSDFNDFLPISYTVSSPIQPSTNTGLRGVLRITDAHVSSSGDVTYQVRSETVLV